MKTKQDSASAPGHSWVEDPNTGLWRPGADRVGISTGGTARWEVDSSGHLIPAADNTYNLGSSAASVKDLWVDGTFNGAGVAAATWTPNLIALTTSPTLGTGNSVAGYYTLIGDHVSAWVSIKWGTAATSAGSGQYRIDNLPFSANATAHPLRAAVGEGRIRCAGSDDAIVCSIISGTTCNFLVARTGGVVAHNVPGAWTANDEIFAHFEYVKA